MKTLIAAATAVAALAAAPGAAAHATTQAAAPAAQGSGHRAAAGVTPGEGWHLTTVGHGRRTPEGLRATRQELVLIAPDGDRTRVGPTLAPRWRLVDWSTDGRTALLTVDHPHRAVLSVDVPTGATTRTRLSDRVAEVVLAPDGDGLLTVDFQGRDDRAPLRRVAADGTVTRLADDVDGPVLPTPDGTGLVTHGTDWRQRVIRVLSTVDGSVLSSVRAPRGCVPVRWWDDRRVVVSCLARGASTLGLVDVEASTFERLTERRRPQRQDLGHLDAQPLGGRVYVQVGGPCGYVYLGRQHRDGRITKVRVRGAVGSVLLVDAHRGRLTLQHAVSCDGAAPRSALTRFDPSTGRERRLVVLPRTAAFGPMLTYGARQPTRS